MSIEIEVSEVIDARKKNKTTGSTLHLSQLTFETRTASSLKLDSL